MKRSKFSLSHYKLFTCKMGQLVPTAWYEALPGDTIQAATSALVRCAPLVTPDALQKTLETLQEVAQERQGELWCVFGCGGDRDPGKRPQMGKVAQLAQHVIVTSDNPRTEDPAKIILLS